MTNEVKTDIPSGPRVDTPSAASQADGLAELKALETQLGASKPGRKDEAAPGGASSPGTESPTDAGRPRRKKFKKLNPEHTIRLTLRQYWRFRDWLARRSLGIPSEYAGVFIQGKDSILIEPMIEPVIGCMDTYLPEEWIVFFEEKAPILQLLVVLFEAEQTFAAQVSQGAKEFKTAAPGGASPASPTEGGGPRPAFPSLKETTGKEARVTA